MPIYEYTCEGCNATFEEFHRHADDIVDVECPSCHKPAHRVISNTTFVLKGGGWYVTEYGNRKSGEGASASSSGSVAKDPAVAEKKDAAPAAKSESVSSAAPAAKAETAPPAATPAKSANAASAAS